jgi:hypothetical protein
MLKGYNSLLSLRKVGVLGVIETVFAMRFRGERADGLKRGIRYTINSDKIAHNLAYAVNIYTKRENRAYLVCMFWTFQLSIVFHFHFTSIVCFLNVPVSNHRSIRTRPIFNRTVYDTACRRHDICLRTSLYN